ncbi:MAG: MGMT family protein [Firmicutes bacterium]|nr:MGMT family protein [Bacillota bacterium]
MTLYERIYQAAAAIPRGKVASYGTVARAAGTGDARRVGWALHVNPDNSRIPCHRVVMKDGGLAPGFAFGGPENQRRLLAGEGVGFSGDKVDTENYMLTPDELSNLLEFS